MNYNNDNEGKNITLSNYLSRVVNINEQWSHLWWYVQ